MLGVARFPDGLPEPQWLSDAAVCQLIPGGCLREQEVQWPNSTALGISKNFWDKC